MHNCISLICHAGLPNLLQEGCGFEAFGARNQVYHLYSQGQRMCLAGTGEMPLAGLFANTVIPIEELPKK